MGQTGREVVGIIEIISFAIKIIMSYINNTIFTLILRLSLDFELILTAKKSMPLQSRAASLKI